MKDIIITQKRIRTELLVIAVCFAIAFIANVVAVFIYKSPLSEIYSSIFYVLTATLVLYVLALVLRLIVLLPISFIRKFKK